MSLAPADARWAGLEARPTKPRSKEDQMKRCITLFALGVCGYALAQEPLPPFEEVDSNQDGQISRTEASAIEGLD
nr:hypothetical protein [Gammaproteobacteria bacterium]